MPKSKVHFHSSDSRFCGSDEAPREFTLEPNDVTCKECQDKDTFVLSESGRKYLASLDSAATSSS